MLQMQKNCGIIFTQSDTSLLASFLLDLIKMYWELVEFLRVPNLKF